MGRLRAVIASSVAVIAMGVGAIAATAAPIAFSTCAKRAPVQCGTLVVPLDRTDPAKGTLSLHVERLRARTARTGVLVLLAGGPGEAGTPISPDDPVAAAIPGWDLVMLDQRGTGKGALRCGALDRRGSSQGSDDIARCAGQIGPRRAFFTTADTVLDIEDLRGGLGEERIALGGISYGTYVTQYYAQRFPTRLSHMVLDSVVDPASMNGFEPQTLGAVSRVLTDLCSRNRCRGITPDPVADIAGLVAATANRPLRGNRTTARGTVVRDALGGPGAQGDFLSFLISGDLGTTLRAMWPAAAHAARRGDAAPMMRLATLATSGSAPPPTEISSALYFSTLCADMDLPWSTSTPVDQRAGAARSAADALGAAAFAPFAISTAVAGTTVDSCRTWPEARVDPLGPQPLPAVPTLLMDGGQDLRTPVESATAVAARIAGATVLVAPGAGHSILYQYPCARAQLRNLMSGRRVSTAACNREAPIPGVIPIPPSSVGALRPTGAPGTAGRVAHAARAAIQDGVQSLPAADEAGLAALPGIRGGLARSRDLFGGVITYSRFSAVSGVRVTGTLTFNGTTFQGAVRVDGPGTWDGTLYLARGGQRAYTGSIGGVPVRIPLG